MGPFCVSPTMLHALRVRAIEHHVLDVRRDGAFAASPRIIPGAIRCAHQDAVTWARLAAPSAVIICVCVHGHNVSQAAAAALRDAGYRALFLEGGLDAWLDAGRPSRSGDLVPTHSADRQLLSTTWVAPTVMTGDDLVAAWIVRRMIDPAAAILHVERDQIGAVADDMGARVLTARADAASREEGFSGAMRVLLDFDIDDLALERMIARAHANEDLLDACRAVGGTDPARQVRSAMGLLDVLYAAASGSALASASEEVPAVAVDPEA